MRIKVFFFIIAFTILLAPFGKVTAAQQSDEPVYFGVRLTPGLVDWFNKTARPQDVAAVTPKEIDLLDQITVGRKQILFASGTQALELIPTVADRFDLIGYDPEHWTATPTDEQGDLVVTIQQMRELADKYDLELGVGPDRAFALEFGVQMAPYVDQFALQAQRLQSNPQRFMNFTDPLLAELRAANPDIKIIVQIRTEGSIEDIFDLVNSLEGQVDGVGILYTSATITKMQDMVDRLQVGAIVRDNVEAIVATAVLSTPFTFAPDGTKESVTAVAPTAESDVAVVPTAAPLPTTAPLPTPEPSSTLCISPLGIIFFSGAGFAAVVNRRRKQST